MHDATDIGPADLGMSVIDSDDVGVVDRQTT
jgi:hypothetical protein